MIGHTQKELEESRPGGNAYDLVGFCLRQLDRDKKHRLGDEVCRNLTYEELIGTLLQARDELAEGGL